jgi:hypothetical protein
MARNRRTAPDTTGGAQHEEAAQTIRNLRDKIEWIDALVQEAACDVDALVEGARAAMMSGNDLVAVYRLLGSIGDRVDYLTNQVNSEAEEVGANYRSGDHPEEVAAHLVFQRWSVKKESIAVEASHA